MRGRTFFFKVNTLSRSSNCQSELPISDQTVFQTLIESIAYTSPNLIPLFVFV